MLGESSGSISNKCRLLGSSIVTEGKRRYATTIPFCCSRRCRGRPVARLCVHGIDIDACANRLYLCFDLAEGRRYWYWYGYMYEQQQKQNTDGATIPNIYHGGSFGDNSVDGRMSARPGRNRRCQLSGSAPGRQRQGRPGQCVCPGESSSIKLLATDGVVADVLPCYLRYFYCLDLITCIPNLIIFVLSHTRM